MSKSSVQKNKIHKFKESFAKVLKSLEKNAIRVCDPSSFMSNYRKLQYKVPKEITESYGNEI